MITLRLSLRFLGWNGIALASFTTNTFPATLRALSLNLISKPNKAKANHSSILRPFDASRTITCGSREVTLRDYNCQFAQETIDAISFSFAALLRDLPALTTLAFSDSEAIDLEVCFVDLAVRFRSSATCRSLTALAYGGGRRTQYCGGSAKSCRSMSNWRSGWLEVAEKRLYMYSVVCFRYGLS